VLERKYLQGGQQTFVGPAYSKDITGVFPLKAKVFNDIEKSVE